MATENQGAAPGRPSESGPWTHGHDQEPQWFCAKCGAVFPARLKDEHEATECFTRPAHVEVAACVCGHARVEHRPFGGLVAYAECHIQDCHCNQFVVRPPDAALASDPRVLAEEIRYLPTCIIDDKGRDATGKISLFVRAFRLRERKGGALLAVANDVWTFADETAMADAIERLGLQELPAEAERDQLYVPDELMLDDARVERTPARIPAPEEAIT